MSDTPLFYKLIGFSIFVFYMSIVPLYFEDIWDRILDFFGNDWKWVYLGLMGLGNIAIFIGGSLVFLPHYKGWFRFWENYKIQFSRRWFWEEEDKKKNV
jgi:hypothetical protein